MDDLPVGAEAVGGLVVGALGALGAAAGWLKKRTDSLTEERAEQKAAHEATLAQQKAEHEARIAVLEAERARAAKGADLDVTDLVSREVARLLPEAVAELQEKERLRVALERQREAAIVERIMQNLADLKGQGEEP